MAEGCPENAKYSAAVVLKNVAVGVKVEYNGSKIHADKNSMPAQRPSGRAFLVQPDDGPDD